MGNWSKIITSQFLPGKTKSQIVAQVQKIIDSLKLAHFAGLKIDLNLLRQFHLCHSPPPSGPYHALLKYWKELRAELEPYQEPLDERSVEILIPFEFHTNRLNLSIKLGIRKKLVESINLLPLTFQGTMSIKSPRFSETPWKFTRYVSSFTMDVNSHPQRKLGRPFSGTLIRLKYTPFSKLGILLVDTSS